MLVVWEKVCTTKSYIYSDCLDPDETHVLRFTFFLFFPALGDKSTVHALLSIVHTLFSIVHELKNIKNESHGTIHTFKNYFTIVFSVSAKISCIQMNPLLLYPFAFAPHISFSM